MVRRCTEVRMPEPDFSDTGQFVTTVWRTSMVTIRCDGHPVSDANVLMLLPNGTWKRATANENGEALLQTESRGVPLDVLVAAKGFSAHVERGWVPAVHPLSLELQGVDGGAAIFSELTGKLPGLKGLLKFTRDSRGRIYLNAANVSINDSQPQPVQCSLGDELHLVDSDGDDLAVRIVDVVGQSALVEYRTSRHQESQSPDSPPESQPESQPDSPPPPESQPESQPDSPPPPESQPESPGSRVLMLLADSPKSKPDLSKKLGQKEVSGQLNKVVRQILAEGMIEYTVPDKPRSRLQKYRVTAKGMAAVARLKHGRIEG